VYLSSLITDAVVKYWLMRHSLPSCFQCPIGIGRMFANFAVMDIFCISMLNTSCHQIPGMCTRLFKPRLSYTWICMRICSICGCRQRRPMMMLLVVDTLQCCWKKMILLVIYFAACSATCHTVLKLPSNFHMLLNFDCHQRAQLCLFCRRSWILAIIRRKQVCVSVVTGGIYVAVCCIECDVIT